MNLAAIGQLQLAADRLKVGKCSAADGEQICPTESDSDEDLLLSVQKGSKDALGILFCRYASLARGIGRRFLRDEGEAEDLIQEVFLFVYRKSRTFERSKGSARSWIVQNIYYRAINRRRYLSSR